MDVLSYFGTYTPESSLFILPYTPSVISGASTLLDNGKKTESLEPV